jgi:uncharacterized tellurite resistance protein B-like protein
MKAIEFQKFLFQSLVSAMAVDGEIHDNEREEIKAIVNRTAYFLDFEFEKELELNISYIKENGKDAINNYLQRLSMSELNEKQEIILIELLLNIILADEKVENNELLFLQMVKYKLKTSEQTLVMKFPKYVDYLIDFNNYGSSSTFNSDVIIS